MKEMKATVFLSWPHNIMKEAFQYIDLNSSWMSFVLNISFYMHEELEQAELKQVYA